MGQDSLDLQGPVERGYQPAHAAQSKFMLTGVADRRIPDVTNNLPREMTSFIGREDEILAIKRLLRESRLITITGSGGCGKSRLALRVAADILEEHPDGVWWAELASISDASLVANAVAAALSIREVHSQLLSRTLSNHLSQSRALIVLDNCEHVVSACADLAGILLEACPGLTILATSREPLGIDAEFSWRVRSLSLPMAEDEATGSLVRSEAVRLFIDRARQRRPDFRLTVGNGPAVTRICTRLDGIPLAIELAAARVRVLAPEQIADGLKDRFRLLTGSSRTAAPRQQTLQASVDWSYNTLSDSERTILTRVSVFAGGFTLAAAEAVANTEGIARDEVLDLVSRLVDRSLVLMDDAGGGARFRLLETIRQYADAKLAEAGAADEARMRHRDYFIGLAEVVEPLLTGHEQEARLVQLDMESDNIRSALEWCRERGDAVELQRLSGALALYWLFRGHLAEGESQLRAALQSSADVPPLVRAKVMWGLGYLCVFTSDAETIDKLSVECLAIAHELGDRQLEARSLLAQGWPALLIGGDSDPIELFERSADLAREMEDSFCLEESLQGLGLSHNFRGDPTVARAALEECLVVARGSGNHWSERQARTWLGLTALFQGELREAGSLLEMAVAESRAADDQYMLSMALFIQGWNQELTGDYAASKKSLEESLEVSRAEGNVFGVALSAMEGAWLEQALGNTEAAAPLEDEAQMLLTALDSVGLDYLNLSLMARGRLARGDIAAAHRILNSADESAMAPGRWTRARFWFAQASLRRHAGAYEEAERKAHEALAAQRQISDKVGIVDSLELLAAVASALESHEEAGRLLGAAAALRDSIGYVRTPPETPGHLALVAAVRAGLGEERLRQAQAEGAVMSVDDALAYASRGRGARKRPTRGWRSITPTEERVIQQVVAGLSNSQIGERLFVSRETIKTHLSSIFGKLGVSTRAELAALASRRGS